MIELYAIICFIANIFIKNSCKIENFLFRINCSVLKWHSVMEVSGISGWFIVLVPLGWLLLEMHYFNSYPI